MDFQSLFSKHRKSSERGFIFAQKGHFEQLRFAERGTRLGDTGQPMYFYESKMFASRRAGIFARTAPLLGQSVVELYGAAISYQLFAAKGNTSCLFSLSDFGTARSPAMTLKSPVN